MGVQYPAPRGTCRNGVRSSASGFPQPNGPGHALDAPLPASMVTAVRLMYAGAAYALVWAIGTIAVAASIVKHYPVASESGDHRLSGAVTWLSCCAPPRSRSGSASRGPAGAAAAGPGWPGTVLFALHTVGVLGVVASSQAGLGPAKVLTLIGWLIGLGAVLALWQRPSSAFFTARASLNR